ncbi:MAG: hypothetical protein LUG45_02940 [Clostridiales bacterium]|nr:hypothetical protein [Clostridiales bacterium]
MESLYLEIGYTAKTVLPRGRVSSLPGYQGSNPSGHHSTVSFEVASLSEIGAGQKTGLEAVVVRCLQAQHICTARLGQNILLIRHTSQAFVL